MPVTVWSWAGETAAQLRVDMERFGVGPEVRAQRLARDQALLLQDRRDLEASLVN